jgi:hypothetical protein
MDDSDAYKLQHGKKVTSFIVIEDSFPFVTMTGVIKSHL